MDPYELFDLIFFGLLFWGISLGYLWAFGLRKPTFLGFDRNWHGMLAWYERSILLFLAPLTLLAYFVCWLCTGGSFGDWLYEKLAMRYVRKHGVTIITVTICY